jgi:isopenicillin-N epimerase
MVPDPVLASADEWVNNLHKWVCESTGAAVIVARRDSGLKPTLRSWTSDLPFPQSFTWLATDSKAAYLPAPLATEIMTGLLDAGLDTHIRSILDEAGGRLVDAWGVDADPRPDGMAAPWMRLIEVPHHRPIPQDELNGASLLVRDQLDADVIFTQFKEKTFVRLSAHGYNMADQYENLVSIPDVIRGY